MSRDANQVTFGHRGRTMPVAGDLLLHANEMRAHFLNQHWSMTMNKIIIAVTLSLLSASAFAKGDGLGPFDQDISVDGVLERHGMTGSQPEIGSQLGADLFEDESNKYPWRDPGRKQ